MHPETIGVAPPIRTAVALRAPARWYACYTRARAEKQVTRLLELRGIEAFLPTVRRERAWADRRKVVDLPLFPSYVFGRFPPRALHHILSVPGVATVVRSGDRLAPVPDGEIENIRRLQNGLARTGQRPDARPLQPGRRVTVIAGPFGGVDGVVVQLRGGRRVLVGLGAIGQGLPLDIPEGYLRAVGEEEGAVG